MIFLHIKHVRSQKHVTYLTLNVQVIGQSTELQSYFLLVFLCFFWKDKRPEGHTNAQPT